MKTQFRRYAWSYAIGLMLTILLGLVSVVPGCSAVGVLLAPGMFLAAVLFREGIHSAWPMTWFVLAGLMDAFVFSWLVMFFWTIVPRLRQANTKGTSTTTSSS